MAIFRAAFLNILFCVFIRRAADRRAASANRTKHLNYIFMGVVCFILTFFSINADLGCSSSAIGARTGETR